MMKLYCCGQPLCEEDIIGWRRWYLIPIIGWVAYGTVFPYMWWGRKEPR